MHDVRILAARVWIPVPLSVRLRTCLLISQNLGLLLHKMGIINPALEGDGTS